VSACVGHIIAVPGANQFSQDTYARVGLSHASVHTLKPGVATLQRSHPEKRCGWRGRGDGALAQHMEQDLGCGRADRRPHARELWQAAPSCFGGSALDGSPPLAPRVSPTRTWVWLGLNTRFSTRSLQRSKITMQVAVVRTSLEAFEGRSQSSFRPVWDILSQYQARKGGRSRRPKPGAEAGGRNRGPKPGAEAGGRRRGPKPGPKPGAEAGGRRRGSKPGAEADGLYTIIL